MSDEDIILTMEMEEEPIVPKPTIEFDKEHVDRAQLYAWEWFKFHAKQRTDVFNYFIVTTGILAAAYGSLLQHDRPGLAFIIALGGIVLSLGFWLLDCRNKQIIDLSANILSLLEQEYVFKGIVLKDGPAYLCQPDRDTRKGIQKLVSHKWVFRGYQYCAVIGWILLAIGIVPGKMNGAVHTLFHGHHTANVHPSPPPIQGHRSTAVPQAQDPTKALRLPFISL